MKMGWPPWGRVARKALREVPWEGTPGEIPLAAERLLGGPVYESWVDGEEGVRGRKFHGFRKGAGLSEPGRGQPMGHRGDPGSGWYPMGSG